MAPARRGINRKDPHGPAASLSKSVLGTPVSLYGADDFTKNQKYRYLRSPRRTTKVGVLPPFPSFDPLCAPPGLFGRPQSPQLNPLLSGVPPLFSSFFPGYRRSQETPLCRKKSWSEGRRVDWCSPSCAVQVVHDKISKSCAGYPCTRKTNAFLAGFEGAELKKPNKQRDRAGSPSKNFPITFKALQQGRRSMKFYF